jgi:wyosine [tRNA(Phe)-imidazoG37] synthetase (radical SAM superfamily)
MPKMLRKQTTFATIFKPKNREEWDSLNKELIQMRDEDARVLFEYVYDKEYAHLDIDTIDNKLYRNFNELTIKKTGDI